MKIKFWGTRGSIATPEPEYMKFGGNTPCVEVRTSDGNLLILDAGTGIRRLGLSLLSDPAFSVKREGHLLITHYHWDHIQGFPFFVPAFIPEWRFEIYGQFKVDGRLSASLTGQMEHLYFPVRLEDMGARMEFHELIEEEFKIGRVDILTRALNHPQGNLGFRIRDDNGIFAYVTDTEHYEDRLDHKVLELAENADLFVYDTMFSPQKYTKRKGWGHSTWEAGVAVAREVKAKKLVLFHHDPEATDDEVERLLADATRQFPATIAASRDLEIRLAATTEVPRFRERTTTISNLIRPHYRIGKRGGDLYIEVSSFLERFNSDEFKEQVISKLAGGVKRVVFDVSALEEIDSLALGNLAYFLERAEERGARLYVTGASPFIKDVLTLTRFNQVLTICKGAEIP